MAAEPALRGREDSNLTSQSRDAYIRRACGFPIRAEGRAQADERMRLLKPRSRMGNSGSREMRDMGTIPMTSPFLILSAWAIAVHIAAACDHSCPHPPPVIPPPLPPPPP
eukprot:1546403-Pyramimonas_sp.AAC.1